MGIMGKLKWIFRDRQAEKDKDVLRGLMEIVQHSRDDLEWFEARLEENKRNMRETLNKRLGG